MTSYSILVTGAAGFLGSHLSEYFKSQGCYVIGIDNFFRGKYIPKGCDFEKLDLTNQNDLNKLKNIIKDNSIDIVVHYAAINGTQYFYEIPFDVFSKNIEMTKNLINIINDSDVKKIVYASSSEVYGEPLKIPIPENHPIILDINAVRDSYAASKAFGEFLIKHFSEEFGFKYLILRIFNTYGPRMDTSKYGQVIPEFIRKALLENEFTIYGDGNQTRAFTYVDDHTRLVWKLMLKADNYVVNVGSDKEIKIIELAKLIHELINKEFKPVFLPPRPNDRIRRAADISLLRKLVDDEPKISLKEGLIKTIEWYSKLWNINVKIKKD
ncbi:MAG: NAD-dependent epimerase/dehydratase family protein [Candidatus Aenigmatarchaeota archaeon]